MHIKLFICFIFIGCFVFLDNACSQFQELFKDTTLVAEFGSTGNSSPAIGELDGDMANGDEIVVGQRDGSVVAINKEGSKLWRTYLASSQCVITDSSKIRLYSSPNIADLNGDGRNEVVIGYGPMGVSGCDGGVVTLDGGNGAIIWDFNLKLFSKSEKFWAKWHGVYGKPAVADTNGDGKMEIGFGAFDRNIYLLNYDGSVRWYYQAADTVWSSGVFADINGDRILEFIIGTDIFGNKNLRPIVKNGGYLYAFKTAPKVTPKSKKFAKKMNTFREKKAFFWMRHFDQIVQSAPRIGEIIRESPGQEIAIGSGCFYPERDSNKTGKEITILSLKTGNILKKLPTINCFSSSPALKDINGDGSAEVFATVSNSERNLGDSQGRLVAYDAQNSIKLWEVIPTYKGRPDPNLGDFKSPVITDLDKDGVDELLVSVMDGVSAFSLTNGEEVNCRLKPCSSNSSSRSASDYLVGTSNYLFTSPIVADIDKDGINELIVGGRNSYSFGVYGWHMERRASRPESYRRTARL